MAAKTQYEQLVRDLRSELERVTVESAQQQQHTAQQLSDALAEKESVVTQLSELQRQLASESARAVAAEEKLNLLSQSSDTSSLQQRALQQHTQLLQHQIVKLSEQNDATTRALTETRQQLAATASQLAERESDLSDVRALLAEQSRQLQAALDEKKARDRDRQQAGDKGAGLQPRNPQVRHCASLSSFLVCICKLSCFLVLHDRSETYVFHSFRSCKRVTQLGGNG